MREGFEQTLGTFSDLAKQQESAADTQRQQRLEHELELKIQDFSDSRESSPASQQEIFEIQKQKQAIMDRLHTDFANLDNSEFKPEKISGRREVVSGPDGKMYFESAPGQIEPITEGEIITDAEWDVFYNLDKTVPHITRKIYLVEKAKRELRALLDKQIAIDQVYSDRTPEHVKATYDQVMRDRKNGELKPGLIAEKMVRNFLKKIAIDTDIDFEIEEADLFQDINQKIDFIIRRRSHNRGVEVKSEHESETVGVQFTTNTSKENLEHKAEQVQRARRHLRPSDHIDDLVIVSIPLSQSGTLYNKWAKNKQPGGPDKLWSPSLKQQIFTEVIKGLPNSEEIKKQWDTDTA